MSDEQQIRTLLARAAELPDTIAPQPGPLLARGRRRRALRTAASALAACVAVAAAVAIPLAVRGSGTGQPSAPSGQRLRMDPIIPPATGPSASQLAGYRWSALASSPLGAVQDPALVWTGHVLLELGGMTRDSSASSAGAAFDPATGQWHRMAQMPGSIGTEYPAVAWTGAGLFVADGQAASCPGGRPASSCRPRAGLYDPAANRWSTVALPSQLTGKVTSLTAVWTGQDIIVAASSPAGQLAVGALDPATRRWHLISPAIPAGHVPQFAALAATRNGLYLWSAWDHVTRHDGKHGGYSYTIKSGVDVYLSATGRFWQRLRVGWPQHQTAQPPLYTGTELLFGASQIWCGAACSPPSASMPGFFAAAATLHRSKIPGGPLAQADPVFIWTGRALIAQSQARITGQHVHITPDDLAAWDAASRRWYRLRAVPGLPDLAANLVWAGRSLLALTSAGALLSLHP